jgi:hypothetical protein
MSDENGTVIPTFSRSLEQSLQRALALANERLCLLKTSSIGGILAIPDPKAPGIIKFS